MPHYKLTYFNARGRAEMSRLILAQAAVPYDDVRLERDAWPKLKPSTPFGQIPLLEVDGKVISQSKAIARFLARQHGLAGKNDLEAAFCDGLVDGIDDTTSNLGAWFMEQDPEKKKQLWADFREKHLKPFLVRYEKFLTDNGTGFFVGNQLTWADLTIFDLIQNYCSDMLGPHAKLQEFVKKIENIPNIKAWLDKRPKTQF